MIEGMRLFVDYRDESERSRQIGLDVWLLKDVTPFCEYYEVEEMRRAFLSITTCSVVSNGVYSNKRTIGLIYWTH